MGNVNLVITKTINASPERVFKAWIDPKEVVEWYGPEGFSNTIHTFEPEEGGKYRLTMKAPDGAEHVLTGVFKKVNPPNQLVMTWQWEGGEMAGMTKESVVTVDFKDLGGKTEMTLTHSGFADEAEKENHNQGWTSSFAKLLARFNS